MPPTNFPSSGPIAKPKRTALVLAIIFGLLTLILGGACIWLAINYLDQKNNVDQKVAAATAEAVKNREDELEKDCSERQKEPMSQFVGPDDLGRLAFRYPKTWSVYIAKNSNPYEVYFNPKQVQPSSSSSRYALRVSIENKDYDAVIKSYDNLIKKGDLKVSTLAIDGTTATRLDGKFTKEISGSAVIYRIRDKTVTLRTDVDETFKPDFDKLVNTVTFNK